MMIERREERRRHERYSSKGEVSYKIIYDFKARICYQILDSRGERVLSRKFQGISEDVSAEGLRFSTAEKLNPGDLLRLEVIMPGQKEVIVMDGQVRWSQLNPFSSHPQNHFSTGVKILSVNQKPVSPSIRFNAGKGVIWSNVLEAILKDLLESDKSFWSKP